MKLGPNANRGAAGDPYRNLIADIINRAMDDLLPKSKFKELDELRKIHKDGLSDDSLGKEELDRMEGDLTFHNDALFFLRHGWGERLLELLDLDVVAVKAAIRENYGWNM